MIEEERVFLLAAKRSAYRSWWIMNKTLEDCPYCGDTSYLKDEATGEYPEHEEDCPLGLMIAAYWKMREVTWKEGAEEEWPV